MKKICFVFLMISSIAVWGQAPDVSSPTVPKSMWWDTCVLDTVVGRNPKYHYTTWYDICPAFFDTTPGHFTPTTATFTTLGGSYGGYYRNNFMIFKEYTSDTLVVRGLSCVASDSVLDNWGQANGPIHYYYTPQHDTLPEHLYLISWDEDLKNPNFTVIDSAQWNDKKPHVTKIPRHNDTATYGFSYGYEYEAYFTTSHKVIGHFYIMASHRGNAEDHGIVYHHQPVFYSRVNYQPIHRCWDGYPLQPNYLGNYYIEHPGMLGPGYHWCPGKLFGPSCFHAIVQLKRMVVAEADEEGHGRVEGGGERYDSTYITLTAVPEVGYRFGHWSDGDTNNPRQVYVLSDTSFVASFEPKAVYRLATESSYPILTTIEGAGLYYDQDTAVLYAHCSRGIEFEAWDDGDTCNPRQVVVTQDTSFAAKFRLKYTQDIAEVSPSFFSIRPNPAHNEFRVVVNQFVGKDLELVLRDASGRLVRRMKMDSDKVLVDATNLPAGAYWVTLELPDGKYATQKLIIK